jgi:ATP-binding cassette subfamily F protein 3
LVIVSHDRDFLQGLTNRLYEFRNKGIKEYRGDINLFLEKRKLVSLNDLDVAKASESNSSNSSTNSKERWENKKEYDKKIRKLKSEILKIESLIETNETDLVTINEKLSKPQEFEAEISSGKLYIQHDKINQNLETAFENWDLKHKELEKLENGTMV